MCVLYEQLHFVSDFQVHLMSDVVGALNCPGVTKIPDHSVLTLTVVCRTKKREVRKNKSSGKPLKYNTRNIPGTFLNDDSSFDWVVAAIDKNQRDLELLQDANSAYLMFKELVFSEMDSNLPKRKVNNCENKTAKSLYKPYWSNELPLKWDAVYTHERNWLGCNGRNAEKRRLSALYVCERWQFEKMNKKAKEEYQLGEQTRLRNLKNGHDTREFWLEIGKLGIQNGREKREFQWKLDTYQHIPMMSWIGGKMILRTCFQIPQRLIMTTIIEVI